MLSNDLYPPKRWRTVAERFALPKAVPAVVFFGCAALLALSLSGCSVYHTKPLPEATHSPYTAITLPASTWLPGGLSSHPFDPTDGLDMTETATLAIAQSPQLKSLRAQAEVTRAQSFAAGLLPDPQINYSQDRPGSGQNGASTAYSRGLSWDVGNLVTLSARRSAGRDTARAVDLSLLWNEWQTVSEARLRFVRVRSAQALVTRLRTEQEALAPLQPRLRDALSRGALTFDVATTGLSAFSDVARQLVDAQTASATATEDLKNLLGLDSKEPLILVGDSDVEPAGGVNAEQALSEMTQRRPDLLALKAGYAAQDSRYRAAILGQFPAINIGINRAQDNTHVDSRGFAVGVSLPLFDANRGNIRIEQATREQLYAEYEERLISARNDVARLEEVLTVLEAREAVLGPFATDLTERAQHAHAAYTHGDLEWTTYLGLRQSTLAADVELISLRETLAETRIALATLLSGRWTDRQQSPTAEGVRP